MAGSVRAEQVRGTGTLETMPQIRIVGVVGRDCRRQCRDQQDARHHDRADKAKRLATGKAQAPSRARRPGHSDRPHFPVGRATTFAVIRSLLLISDTRVHPPIRYVDEEHGCYDNDGKDNVNPLHCRVIEAAY